jgi:hypothetical protein
VRFVVLVKKAMAKSVWYDSLFVNTFFCHGQIVFWH